MASAKFLEEALSTDVDESAVNAIVGSLETQLVTATPTVSSQQGPLATVTQNHMNSAISNGGTVSTQKHGVANGGPGSINIILNSDNNKPTATSALQSSNVVHSSVVNTVVPSLHGGVPASGYVNQVTSSASQTGISNVSKPHESVKIVYPSGSQSVNNRVSFQPGGLPNGNLGIATLQSHGVLNAAVTSSVQSVVSQSHSQSGSITSKPISVDHTKTQGATLVIKASATPSVSQGSSLSGSVGSVPVTVNSTMTLTGTYVNTAVGSTATTGMVTIAKPVIPQGVTPGTTIIPANVQLVNVRAGTPGLQSPKNLSSRVVIGQPHMVSGRPAGQITLLQPGGLQPGTQGHILLKTENGQYQLLRVGPAPTNSATAAAAVTPTTVSITTNSMPSGAYRIQPVPPHGTVTVATTTAAAATATIQATQQQSALTTSQNTAVQRHPVDTTKEKCRKFLANLLELSSREPKAVERNVRTLIQELIDTKVEPEEFCDRLERLLNASPQPCLIGFLKKSLPLLRQSLVTKELVIDGIRPPPHTVVYSLPNSAVPQLQPVRTQAPVSRMMTTTALRPQSPITTTTPSLSAPSPSPIRTPNPSLPAPPLHVKQASQIATKPNAAMLKTPSLAYPKPQLVSHTKTSIATKPPTPSLLPKPASKEKEKRSFSSAGYAGDDDINDVAAMGGVNLAEETQRILGSTEFVGTEIRSCKDEVFLHMGPLQHKIRQIVSKHGLDEPSPEVATLISHACQERLKTILQKLSVIGEHRIDVIKMDPRFEVQHDIKGQLKFLEELDRVERKRHDEHERELLLRAAKSRSKSEDPEQAKLKAKAKEMQRAEMEELRQREANLTALQAIGPRKKPKLEFTGGDNVATQSGIGSTSGASSSISRTQLPIRPRVKRINVRDLLFLLEQEKDTCSSSFLYRSYLK